MNQRSLLLMLREHCGTENCGHCQVEGIAADEIERLQTELNRANRIARAADRMADVIRGLPFRTSTLRYVIAAADAYDVAMSDPVAEAEDRSRRESCT